MANKKDKNKFDAKYFSKKYRSFVVRFNKVKDKDVIETIDAQPNKIDYFRRIITKDMKKHIKAKNS